MATGNFRIYSGTKRQSCDNDDIDIGTNCIPVKRRRMHDPCTYAFHNYNKENEPFSIAPAIQTPFKFEPIDFNPTSKPHSHTYIKTGLQKLTEFWRKMIGCTDTKPIATLHAQPPPTPQIETKAHKTPNYINFDNGTHHFDFQSLLKSLTADSDKAQESEEFNYLAKQISQLNINLSARQMQEIIREEEEMKSMIESMKGLNINVDNKYNEEMIVVLQRLSELTFDCEDSGEFDVDEDYKHRGDIGDEQINKSMQRDKAMVEHRGCDSDMDSYRISSVEVDKQKQREKQKQKSIVHKCTEFMLSMLMVGAPLFYYYVN